MSYQQVAALAAPAPGDELLMARLRAGNAEGLEELFQRYRLPLFQMIFRYVGDRHLAEEIYQETFLRVYRHRDRFRPDTRFRPWVFAIATNLCRDHFRRLKRRREVPLPEVMVDPQPGPAERAGSALDSIRVRHAIAELPEQHREVLLLRHFSELSVEETAQALGIPTGTVKSRLHHALAKLMKVLEAEQGRQ